MKIKRQRKYKKKRKITADKSQMSLFTALGNAKN
jgi:hypothetical protein